MLCGPCLPEATWTVQRVICQDAGCNDFGCKQAAKAAPGTAAHREQVEAPAPAPLCPDGSDADDVLQAVDVPEAAG